MYKYSKLKVSMLIAVIMLAIFAAGCKMSQISNLEANQGKGQKTVASKNAPEKLDDPNITIFGTDDPTWEEITKPVSLFEEKYGGKATYVYVTGNEKKQKLITSISAGDPYDVVLWTEVDMPTYAVKNLIQPIEGYFNLSDPIWNKNAMDQAKYKNAYYGVSRNVVSFFMYFNKTMFENNGLKTPLEHYKEGKWNWDTFRESAIKLTQDTNGDGAVDQWGFGGGNTECFITANGGFLVNYEADGSVKLTIDEPAVIEALQFIQDGLYKDKYSNPKFSTQKQDFPAGKLAMYIERKGSILTVTTDMKYEWDVVPFPAGPNGNANVLPGAGAHWGISTGAKNPKGAAAWIYMYTKLYDDYRRFYDIVPEEKLNRIKEMEKNVVFEKARGIGDFLKVFNSNVRAEIAKGTPVHTAIEKAKPLLQNEIDLIFKDN